MDNDAQTCQIKSCKLQKRPPLFSTEREIASIGVIVALMKTIEVTLTLHKLSEGAVL